MNMGGDYHKPYPFATATDDPLSLTGLRGERTRKNRIGDRSWVGTQAAGHRAACNSWPGSPGKMKSSRPDLRAGHWQGPVKPPGGSSLAGTRQGL